MDTRRLLLVEDNPSDVELTRRALGLHHIANELVVVNDGQEALDYLLGGTGAGDQGSAEPAPLPALVMLDLKLPRVDGLEVLRAIRQSDRTRRLPVVILTSSNEERDVAAGYDLGVNSYIRKPVDFLQFSEAMRTLGMYWLVLNEPPPSK